MSWSMSLFGETLTTDRGVADPPSPKASTQIVAHGGEDEKGGKKIQFLYQKGETNASLTAAAAAYNIRSYNR